MNMCSTRTHTVSMMYWMLGLVKVFSSSLRCGELESGNWTPMH